MLFNALCKGQPMYGLLTKTISPQARRVMKLTAIILFVAALHVSAKGLGQQISLDLKDTPLEKVFTEIEKQSGYQFFYKISLVVEFKNVDVVINNANIEQTLCKIFKNQALDFNIVGKTIVVTKKDESKRIIEQPPPIDVHGRVVDSTGSPMIGATVKNNTIHTTTLTDDEGEFSIHADVGDEITVSFVGYKSKTFKLTVSSTNLAIQLSPEIARLKEVVVNTGYQLISKGKITGSVVELDKQTINRSVGTNFIDRLTGLVPGLLSLGSYTPSPSADPNDRYTGLSIRGLSTLYSNVGTDPLIVLDNFPYDGDLNNINPNDIESISILKDAAAASVWGARGGNGVIVISTKKGKLNQSMQVNISANTTITNRPNIYKDRAFLDANDYINAETYIFNQGFYDYLLDNTYSYPAVSPVVAILAKQRSGQLSAAEASAQINALRKFDVRDQAKKYGYQKGINQQYSLGINGGSNNMTYELSIGRDQNKSNMAGLAFHRTTINANTSYRPIKNLEINSAINYAQAKYFNAVGALGYKGIYPYAQFADANGDPLPIASGYSSSYIDSVGKMGFLDWHNRPLQDLRNGDNTTSNTDLLLRISARYKITPYLNVQVSYQNEHQNNNNRNYQNLSIYYTRNLINQFSRYDRATGKINYVLPLGGILNQTTVQSNSNNYRFQLNFNKNVANNHNVSAFAGGEIREVTTRGTTNLAYGVDPDLGTSNNYLDYLHYLPTNPSGSQQITAPDGSVTGVNLHYVSYFAGATYSYKNLFIASLTGKRDGANLFGVKTNDKITPLWAASGAWNISNQPFYHVDFIPQLKLRVSYGYAGNVYNGSAYVTGGYGIRGNTGANIISAITPPNPSLRWERVRTTNLGIDFSLKKDILFGTIELYKKDGLDLIEDVPLAPSVGFTSFKGNAASTTTKGIDIQLGSRILNQGFKWTSTLNFSYLKDKLSKYDVPQTNESMIFGQGIVGGPVYGVYSYKWAGLDPATGDPQGYLNGKISKDYAGIINNFNPDSLVFSGSRIPTTLGSLTNDFSYKGFSLSVMITYKLGYYFRKPSISGNFYDIVNGFPNVDYINRWQKPGDEKKTNIPSLVYYDYERATFYQYSQVLIDKASHIRLQNIRLAYDLTPQIKKAFSSFQVFTFANNLGLLWVANKDKIDPDTYSSYPNPFSISFGLQATLK